MWTRWSGWLYRLRHDRVKKVDFKSRTVHSRINLCTKYMYKNDEFLKNSMLDWTLKSYRYFSGTIIIINIIIENSTLNYHAKWLETLFQMFKQSEFVKSPTKGIAGNFNDSKWYPIIHWFSNHIRSEYPNDWFREQMQSTRFTTTLSVLRISVKIKRRLQEQVAYEKENLYVCVYVSVCTCPCAIKQRKPENR